MKKKNLRYLALSLVAVSCLSGTVFTVLGFNKNALEVNASTIEGFEECENWHNSGKGFILDFTFETPSEAKQNKFYLYDSGWNRLSTVTTLDFDTKGNVTASVGYVIKHDSYYTLVAMYNQFTINSGTTGNETASILHFDNEPVALNVKKIKTIDSNMYVDEDSFIKDDWFDDIHGLMFKAFFPTYNSSSKYGIAIVPNEYLYDKTSGYLEYLDLEGIDYSMAYCSPTQLVTTDELYAKYGAGYTIQASLKVKEENYLRDFSAVAFEEPSSGTKKYAYNVNEVKANLYNTSTNAIKKGGLPSDVSTYVNNVVNNVETRATRLSSTHLNAYPANNLDQIRKNADYSSASTSIALKAATGESEGAQLVLRSSSSTELSYFAAASHLRNGSNVIENSNVEISHELYQNVATNWSETQSHCSYLSQLYPNGYETLTTGYYPDALLPMHVAVRSHQNKINITNGANQALFIKVNVPSDAVSGTYNGKIIIYVPNEGYITVPLSVDVQGFSLEGKKNANSILEISRSELVTLYGSRSSYNNLKSPFYRSAWETLAQRGVCGGNVPYRLGEASDLPGYVEAIKEYVAKSRSKLYLIDFFSEEVSMKWTYRTSSIGTKTIDMTGENAQPIILSDDYNSKVGLKTILQALVNASTDSVNLLEGACIFDAGADEPSIEKDYLRSILNYNSIQNSINYVKTQCATRLAENPAVLKSLEGLTLIVTCGPENGTFSGTYSYANLKSISSVGGAANYCSCSAASSITYTNLGAYCPNVMWNCDNTTHSGSGYSWDALSKVYDGTDTTTKVWEYNCCQPVAPYPSFIINAPMIRSRANRWRHFSLGIQGEFYYMSNRTTQAEDSITTLTEEQIINGQATFQGSYGDGLFMYPCHDLLGYADENLYWLSSLRLENVSEANDDLNYLYYAKELAGSDSSALSSLTTIANSVYTDKLLPYSMTTDDNTLITARNNLISFINARVN